MTILNMEITKKNITIDVLKLNHWLNARKITNQYFEGKYILIFHFCSPKLVKKKWPHYQDLIT